MIEGQIVFQLERIADALEKENQQREAERVKLVEFRDSMSSLALRLARNAGVEVEGL